jgi:hypothetical protein
MMNWIRKVLGLPKTLIISTPQRISEQMLQKLSDRAKREGYDRVLIIAGLSEVNIWQS